MSNKSKKIMILTNRFKYKRLQVDGRKRFLVKSKLCIGCYDVISKEHSGRIAQKEQSAAFAKSNIPLVQKACSQRKGHIKKKMTTILLQCHKEIRNRKRVRLCASTVASPSCYRHVCGNSEGKI